MERPRPEVLNGSTRRFKTGCGYIYVIVNRDYQGIPFEVFTSIGKAGGCAGCQAEAIARLVSLSLRIGADVREVIKQLKGISCHQAGEIVLSCPDAIAKALEDDS